MIFVNHQLYSDVSNLTAQNLRLNTGNDYLNHDICCAKCPILKEHQSDKSKPSVVGLHFPASITIQHQLRAYILFSPTWLYDFDVLLIY